MKRAIGRRLNVPVEEGGQNGSMLKPAKKPYPGLGIQSPTSRKPQIPRKPNITAKPTVKPIPDKLQRARRFPKPGYRTDI